MSVQFAFSFLFIYHILVHLGILQYFIFLQLFPCAFLECVLIPSIAAAVVVFVQKFLLHFFIGTMLHLVSLCIFGLVCWFLLNQQWKQEIDKVFKLVYFWPIIFIFRINITQLQDLGFKLNVLLVKVFLQQFFF